MSTLSKTHEPSKAKPVHPKRSEGSHGHLLGDLRTSGLLGQYPLIGVIMFVVGVCLFIALAINLQTNGPLIQTDVQVSNALHAAALQSGPFVRALQDVAFYLGEHIVVVIGTLLSLYFAYKRFWPELSMVLIGWFGEGALWLGLTQLFQRARPVFEVMPWKQMTGPCFPSGHSLGAVICYGFLAYLLVPRTQSRFWKVVIVLVAVFIILFIGFSRVFMGDHYPTDVLAGYALGIAWSGLAYTAVEWITRRTKKTE